jgi:hypothetical protein
MEIKRLMKTKKKLLTAFLLVLALMGLIFAPVLAQTPETAVYRLNFSRDFGYGAGADIKGRFSMSVIGPEGVSAVTYFINGVEMKTVTEQPFKFQFNTSQYDFGWHDLTAVVTNSAGEKFTTPARHLNFVTTEMESAAMKQIILPLLGGIFGVIIIVGLVQFAVMRKRNPAGVEPGTERNYGFAGGSICRKCGRPTPRHVWGFNIGIGKFDRCENCGRWSVMQAAPLAILRAAEVAEIASETAKPVVNEKSEEDKLRDLIEKSKYE